MALQALSMPRFLRKTTLKSNEYNTNFVMLDNDVADTISSPEADKITPLMSKIYMRLKLAPVHLWESPGVLRFEGEIREGKRTKAWDQLCQHLRVSSETANKALNWMHKEGIIGYSAFKNGVGIRIFLNRATGSIGLRTAHKNKSFLNLPPASASNCHASPSAAAYNDSYADLDNSDLDLNPHAPKNGADNTDVGETTSDSEPASTNNPQTDAAQKGQRVTSANGIAAATLSVDEIVNRLRSALEPSLRAVAIQTAQREHERTREWLEKHGIPKASRVAQKEAYNVLRSHGLVNADTQRTRSQLQVGRSSDSYTAPDVRLRTDGEIMEIAETCMALLEAQGKSVEVTLSEINSEGGGWLLPEDAPKVRDATHRLMAERSEGK